VSAAEKEVVDDMWERVALVLLSVAIVYAPLAFGCTTPNTLLGLDGIILCAALAWLKFKVGNRLRPELPRMPLILMGGIGAFAILQAINPVATLDPNTASLIPRENALTYLPHTHDQKTSLLLLPHLLSLGLTLLIVADLCRSRANRWILLRNIALTGLLIALIGDIQKAAGFEEMLWVRPDENAGHPAAQTFFAAFRYHANAAAYLNLCWPAAFALLLRSHQHGWGSMTNLWIVCVIITFGAIFVNTSKFGHAFAIPLALLSVPLFRSQFPAWWRNSNLRSIAVSAIILGTLVVIALPSLSASFDLWGGSTQDSLSGRLTSYEACLQMIQASAIFGHGNGTFHLLFPYYTLHLGNTVGYWHNAHQDYLQLFIEWGVIGGSLWIALLGGGLFRSYRRHFSHRVSDPTTAVALLALTGVFIHGFIDFPLQIGAIQYYTAIYLGLAWRTFSDPVKKASASSS